MRGLGGAFSCPTELNPGLSSPALELEVLREEPQLIIEKRNKDWGEIKEFLSDGTEEAMSPCCFLKK